MMPLRSANRARPGARPEAGRVFPAVLRSEWIKFCSVRSTPLSLLVTAACTVGFGALAANSNLHDLLQAGTVHPDHFDPTATSLRGLLFGQIAMGVLGVLVVSSEFSTGLARTTFAATPARSTVLAAKALVVGGVSVVLGELISFVSWAMGQSILGGAHASASLGQPGVLRAVVSGGLYLGVVGLLGVGLGTAVRHTAGAVTAWFALVFILPKLVGSLPARWAADIGNWMLVDIGDRLVTTTGATSGQLPPAAALSGGAAWVVVALAVGMVFLRLRDI